jgi:hypothetical protein
MSFWTMTPRYDAILTLIFTLIFAFAFAFAYIIQCQRNVKGTNQHTRREGLQKNMKMILALASRKTNLTNNFAS